MNPPNEFAASIRTMGEWVTEAACTPSQAEKWTRDIGTGKTSARMVVEAKIVCHSCPVRQRCLDHAERNQIDTGIWGGKTPQERACRAPTAAKPPTVSGRCGTPNGAQDHYRRGESACDACRAVRREWQRAHRAKLAAKQQAEANR